MNKKTKIILDTLMEHGLITKEEDLTGGDKTSLMFDYMIRKYGYLLENDINTILPDSYFQKGETIHDVMVLLGKYFLSNPQIFEDREKLLEGDTETFSSEKRPFSSKIELPNEPVIFLSNHWFKDDVLATILAAKRRAFIIFGSLPQFYGTIDGWMAAKNGSVMVNRKVAESKGTSVEKGKYVLSKGMSLMVCPEGVWNKSPNQIMLPLWNGFYRMAKKEDGSFYPVVPIIHYISNTHKPGKDNPIHTIVDDPIYLDGMNEQEAVEYIRDRMITWSYKLMEKYGTTTREELLKGYSSSVEAWEDELRKRVATAAKYDTEIEIAADRHPRVTPLSIWEPISQLEVTKANAAEVEHAKKLVKELKSNDFQHRF